MRTLTGIGTLLLVALQPGSSMAFSAAPVEATVPAAGSESIDSLLDQLDRYLSSTHPQHIGLEDVQVEPGDGRRLRQMDRRAERVNELALRAYREFPDSPRRWEAAVHLIRSVDSRRYIEAIVAGYDSALVRRRGGDATADPAQYIRYRADKDRLRDEWRKSVEAIYRRLLAARDVPEAIREEGMVAALMFLDCNTVEDLRALLERFPQSRSPALAGLTDSVYRDLKRADAAAAQGFLHWAQGSANPPVAQRAQAIARVEALKSTPMQMAFTAVDGRAVDLQELRGKVVLIDFWATWCEPCKAELPNIKRVYGRYREQGFEVIGVSLDEEKDRQKLIDYCDEQSLPWPQHFDGAGTKNAYAVAYGISAIPAAFLLDPAGKLADLNPRGEKLDAEVRRLLRQ